MTAATDTARSDAGKEPGGALCAKAVFGISAVKTVAWIIETEIARTENDVGGA